MAAMQIHSAFDGGNARVLSLASNDDGSVTAKVEIVKDPFTEGTDKKQHSQW